MATVKNLLNLSSLSLSSEISQHLHWCNNWYKKKKSMDRWWTLLHHEVDILILKPDSQTGKYISLPPLFYTQNSTNTYSHTLIVQKENINVGLSIQFYSGSSFNYLSLSVFLCLSLVLAYTAYKQHVACLKNRALFSPPTYFHGSKSTLLSLMFGFPFQSVNQSIWMMREF